MSIGFAPSAARAADDVTLPRDTRVPGGIAILDLGAGAESPGAVFYGEYRAPLVRTADGWKAIVGIPLATEPGRQTVRLVAARTNDKDREIAFTVAPKSYATQKLTVEPRKADPLPEDLKRIDAETGRTEHALATYTESLSPTWRWAVPVPGERSDSYGKRRVFNGLPRKPHSGMDIATPTGTPIRNPAAGRVVETGDFFFNGTKATRHFGYQPSISPEQAFDETLRWLQQTQSPSAVKHSTSTEHSPVSWLAAGNRSLVVLPIARRAPDAS
jgi:hypothetical protein